MRLKLAGIWITGDDPRERPGSVICNGTRLMQPADILRAAKAKKFDRKNRSSVYSFVVYREHATLLASEEFCFFHQTDIPSAGLLEMHAEDPGTSVKKMWMEDCVMPSVEVRQVGITSIATYTIHGGEPTRTEPT